MTQLPEMTRLAQRQTGRLTAKHIRARLPANNARQFKTPLAETATNLPKKLSSRYPIFGDRLRYYGLLVTDPRSNFKICPVWRRAVTLS
jgi:hypothetical protein